MNNNYTFNESILMEMLLDLTLCKDYEKRLKLRTNLIDIYKAQQERIEYHKQVPSWGLP